MVMCNCGLVGYGISNRNFGPFLCECKDPKMIDCNHTCYRTGIDLFVNACDIYSFLLSILLICFSNLWKSQFKNAGGIFDDGEFIFPKKILGHYLNLTNFIIQKLIGYTYIAVFNVLYWNSYDSYYFQIISYK